MWPLAAFRPIAWSPALIGKFATSATSTPSPSSAPAKPGTFGTLSPNAKVEIRRQQNVLFEAEVKRQATLIPRIEKILVTMVDIKPGPDQVVVLMNKGISTPYHCAQHISDLYTTRSVIADIGSRCTDMHTPLENECTLRFRHFREPDCHMVNQAYWRSCSFLLGACVSTAFRAEQEVHLHSYPRPTVKLGSFVYDVKMPGLEHWSPTENEIKALNMAMRRLRANEKSFERLSVSVELASKIFKDNPYKLKQVQGRKEEQVTLYRLGDHIDMSVGPMVPSTSFIGKFDIVAIHQILSKTDGRLYRFQGTSIPQQLPMNYFAYNLLLQSAQKLNPLPPQ